MVNVKEGFELDQFHIDNCLGMLRDQAYSTVKSEMENKVRDVNIYLLKQFKAIFKKNPNGTPKNWK